MSLLWRTAVDLAHPPHVRTALARLRALPEDIKGEDARKLFAEHNITIRKHSPFDLGFDTGVGDGDTRWHDPDEQLHTCQDGVERSGVEHYIVHGHEEPHYPGSHPWSGMWESDEPLPAYHPSTYVHQGKTWIDEGHHRILAARMKGEGVEAYHRDVDAEHFHDPGYADDVDYDADDPILDR